MPAAAESPVPEIANSEHAADAYLPNRQRSGIALCLSGGGYRAALFHIGALRRLNELGILSKVTTISSVSGGSIVSAVLADRLRVWPEPGTSLPDWDERIVKPLKAFTRTNIRTPAILSRLLPWNWVKSSGAVEGLARQYRRRLTDLQLSELSPHPRFIFCSTDLSYGVNWVFEKRRMGDYQAGYVAEPDWPLARAVAASSCFPPVFNPMRTGLEPHELLGGKAPQGAARDAAVRGIGLSDGGVYDNMGLEPVWKDHEVVLVSDGGGTFDFGADRGLLWRLQRYTETVSRQASGVRKRWLISNFLARELRGAYWGIGSYVGHYRDHGSGYSKALVDEVVSEVRTDLDAFSEAEASVLENHGYGLAEAAARTHLPDLISTDHAFSVPNPEWMDGSRVREALKESHKLKIPFGRS